MDGVYFPRILFYNGKHGEIMDEIECTVASGPAVFIDYMASLGVGIARVWSECRVFGAGEKCGHYYKYFYNSEIQANSDGSLQNLRTVATREGVYEVMEGAGSGEHGASGG